MHCNISREIRLKSNSKIYHIMCRKLNQQMLFDEEKDYLKYLDLISKLGNKFDISLYGYCLMTNHIHMLIKDKKNKL